MVTTLGENLGGLGTLIMNSLVDCFSLVSVTLAKHPSTGQGFHHSAHTGQASVLRHY